MTSLVYVLTASNMLYQYLQLVMCCIC